jgi:hypothetical protein
MPWIMTVLSLLWWGPVSGADVPWPRFPADGSLPTWNGATMVLASCVSILPQGIYVKGEFQITHVFYGSQTLLHAKFYSHSAYKEIPRISDSGYRDIVPIFSVGEQDFYLIFPDQLLWSDGCCALNLVWPARSIDPAAYRRMQTIMAAMERVQQSQGLSRENEIEALIQSRDPALAQLAIQMMKGVAPDHVTGILREDARRGLLVPDALIDADKILVHNSVWSASELRVDAFVITINGAADENEVARICGWLSHQKNWDALSADAHLRIFDAIMDNAQLNPSERRGRIESLKNLLKRTPILGP